MIINYDDHHDDHYDYDDLNDHDDHANHDDHINHDDHSNHYFWKHIHRYYKKPIVLPLINLIKPKELIHKFSFYIFYF